MDLSIEDLERLFVNPSYSREEIIRTFRAFEKSIKPEKGSVDEVFNDYREVMEEPRAILTPNRRKLIKRALENYTVDDLKLVNRGCVMSPYHMGIHPNNKEGTVWNYPELLYRDPEHIEQFIGFAKAHKITPDAKIRKSDYDGSKQSEYTEFVPLEYI